MRFTYICVSTVFAALMDSVFTLGNVLYYVECNVPWQNQFLVDKNEL